jgi:hypothetical protein
MVGSCDLGSALCTMCGIAHAVTASEAAMLFDTDTLFRLEVIIALAVFTQGLFVDEITVFSPFVISTK